MRTPLLILGTVLALAGCSSESGSPAGGSPDASSSATVGTSQAPDDLPDPCSLLTGAEVKAATGRTFGEGAVNTTVSQEGISACDWQGPGVDTVQALVTTVDAFDSSRQTAADVYGSANDVSIAGVDRAYVVKGGFLIGMDVGKTFLQVSYIASGGPVADAVLKLATRAAGRMS